MGRSWLHRLLSLASFTALSPGTDFIFARLGRRFSPSFLAQHSILAYGTLGLMLNLSFDRDLRARIVELGLLPRLVEFLQQDQAPFQCIVSILYNLTIDELNRAAFAPTDCVPMLMAEVLRTEDSDRAMVEVLALFVNLAMDKVRAASVLISPWVIIHGVSFTYRSPHDVLCALPCASRCRAERVAVPRSRCAGSCCSSAQDCAVAMCENGGLGAIINASLDCNDALLMKIARNISRHEGDMKHGFMDHIDALASAVVANPPDEVLVEMLGVFGNLNIPNVSGFAPFRTHARCRRYRGKQPPPHPKKCSRPCPPRPHAWNSPTSTRNRQTAPTWNKTCATNWNKPITNAPCTCTK